MANKIVVVLPLVRETPGALVYKVTKVTSLPVGQVYIRKDQFVKVDGEWPSSVTVTVEVSEP